MSKNISTCRIHEAYEDIECNNLAFPRDPDGFCILHSRNKEKDPETFQKAVRTRWDQEDEEYHDFQGVFFPGQFDPEHFLGSREFKKAVDFSWATFMERADFTEAIFNGDADFFEATFMERADFSDAIFIGNANFYNATLTKSNFSRVTFTEVADFSEAIFIGQANFYMATFTRWSTFSGATFNEKVFFSEATFNEEAYFYQATFTEEAFFFGATIEGRVFFEGDQSPVFQGDFSRLKLSPEATLRFQDLSLAQAQFTGTDLRRVEFHHVQWNNYWGRQAIYDEILLRQNEKKDPWFRTWLLYYVPYADPPSFWMDRYGEVERLYRNLKINCESQGDFKNAGDFHYGEMEMHRRPSKWRWFPFYWYNLYWALSGYGERPSRALCWLAVFLAAFTSMLAWAGLDPVPPHVPAFGDPFFYLLQKVTLQRPTWAEPMGFGGKLVAGFSVLLIPGQAALFLLALRNRLGRRR